jgi:hypothetical protein
VLPLVGVSFAFLEKWGNLPPKKAFQAYIVICDIFLKDSREKLKQFFDTSFVQLLKDDSEMWLRDLFQVSVLDDFFFFVLRNRPKAIGQDRLSEGKVAVEEDNTVTYDQRFFKLSLDSPIAQKSPHSLVFSDPLGIIVLQQWHYVGRDKIYVIGYYDDIASGRDDEETLPIHWIFEIEE